MAKINPLTETRVKAILSLKGQMTGKDVAELFGISIPMVYSIWSGACHSRVTGLPKPVPKARGEKLKELWADPEYKARLSEPMTKGQLNRWRKNKGAANDN